MCLLGIGNCGHLWYHPHKINRVCYLRKFEDLVAIATVCRITIATTCNCLSHDSLVVWESNISAPSNTIMALAFCASLKKAVTPLAPRDSVLKVWESSSVQCASYSTEQSRNQVKWWWSQITWVAQLWGPKYAGLITVEPWRKDTAIFLYYSLYLVIWIIEIFFWSSLYWGEEQLVFTEITQRGGDGGGVGWGGGNDFFCVGRR